MRSEAPGRLCRLTLVAMVSVLGLVAATPLPPAQAASTGRSHPASGGSMRHAAHNFPHLYLRSLRLPPHTGPQIFLEPSQPLPLASAGKEGVLSRLAGDRARPLALASADFHATGVDDLLAGYGLPGGAGAITLYPGNLDAFAPQTQTSFRAVGQERFPSPFLPNPEFLRVPFTPDFIAAGTFTRQPYLGFAAAARGGHSVYVFDGDGTGRFAKPQVVTLAGGITDLAAGDFGKAQSTLILGVTGHHGGNSSLLVYDGTRHGLRLRVVYSLRAPASNIVFGDLGDPTQDAAFLSGGHAYILRSASLRLVPVSLPFSARALTLGSFVNDRVPGQQMALLASDGSVRLVAHSEFDPRAYSTHEMQLIRHAAPRGRPNPLVPRRSFPSHGWRIIESIPRMAPVTSAHAPLMFTSHITDTGGEDVAVVDPSIRQMEVISHPDVRAGAPTFLPAQISVRPYAGAPIAALPMRVNVDGRPGVVTVQRGETAPSVMMPVPDPTFFVNRFDDPVVPADISTFCNNTSSTDTSTACSLREAVVKANSVAGADAIMLGAGTYTLTQPRVSGDFTGRHGTLDVNDSLTITGATDGSGNPASIIQACDPTPNPTCSTGVDKVFSFNQDISSFTNATVSISNLVIRFGHNRGSFGGLQDGFGGGFDFDTGGTTAGTGNANLTVTNCLITDNATTDGDGGGVAVFNTNSGSGFAHFVDSTIQNNAPARATSGAAGGGIFVGAPGRIVLDTSKVIDNNATQTSPAAGNGGGIFTFGQPDPSVNSAIHGGSIAGNKAAGDGGGLDIDATMMIDSGASISNNQAGTAGGGAANGGNGGGIWFNADAGSTLSVSHVTIAGNSAAGGNGTNPGGGGLWIGQQNNEGVNITFSRLAGNTAPNGSNVRFLGGGSGQSFNATDDWWGTNSPSSTISSGSTTCPGGISQVCFDPFIVLKTTASPSTVNYGASTTLTTSFLQDNHGNSLTTTQIGQLLGLPVSWTAQHGSISNSQSTIQSTGQATATFTAGSTSADCGNVGKGQAQVDQVASGDTTATAAITIQCPDLQVAKTNNVSGQTQLVNTGSPPQTWTWTLSGSNSGPGFASYASGQTILTDSLPNSTITYGTVTETNVSGITGSISCSVNVTDDLTCTANGAVQIGSGGSFTASVVATPSAVATYANPRSPGSCAIDPNNNIPETSDSNNSCSNSVSVTAPDLTVTKSNNVSGSTLLGTSWTWKLHVANTSTAATASFLNGNTILTDTLDNSGNLLYGTPTVGNGTGITNIGNISCSVSSSVLTCAATGTVVLGTSGSFDVSLPVTPSVPGPFANPRSQGPCAVDPNGVVPETNEANNNCNTDTVTVTVSDLTLSKTDTGGFVQGLTGTYSLVVHNSGDGATDGTSAITVTDTLPASLSVKSISGTGWTCTTTPTVGCSRTDPSIRLAAGSDYPAITLVVTIAPNAPTSVTNQADVAGGGEVTTTNDHASDTTAVASGSHLTITKTADASPVSAGASIGYTLLTTNTGTGTAANATLTDPLPGGSGVAWSISPAYSGPGSCSVTGSAPSQTLSCAFGDLNPAAQATVHITSATAFASCGTYTNTASVAADNNPSTTTGGTASITVQCPALSVSKTADAATVSAGNTIGFTITVSNASTAGTGTATTVSLSDPLPGGTDVSWAITTQPAGNPCQVTGTVPSQTLACASLGDLAPGGTASVHITSSTTHASCQSYANTATASAANSPSVTGSATIIVECPSLSLAKTADSPTVSAGSSIGYTITASNSNASGTGTAAGVSMNDPLPGGTGVSWSISPAYTGQGSCSVTGSAPTQALTCAFGSMAPGATNSVHVTSGTTGSSCGTYTNTASLSASNAPNLTAVASTTVQCPSLSVTKTADSATVVEGQSMGFTITVSNSSAAGTGTAAGVALNDPLPGGGGVSWSISPAYSGPGTCSLSGSAPTQTLTCAVGALAPGASASVHVTSPTTTASCGSYANTATASATNQAASVTGSASVTVGCATLTLSKTADTATVNAGDPIGYTLVVGNTGPQTATAPHLSDTLPAGTGLTWSIQSQPTGNPCAIGGTPQVLTCSFSDLAVGPTYTIHITSPTTSASCGSYANSATASATNSPQITASATITVQCPSLSLSKTADSPTVSAGSSIGYTIQVSNSNASGTGTARNVQVSDPLPPGPNGSTVSWVVDPASPNAASCTITGQTGSQSLNCTFGDMAAGLVMSVHVTSATSFTSCGSYANTATLSADNAASLTASATTMVECPSLTLSKTADAATVSAGDSIGYTITASNSSAAGTGTAAGVTVSDPLPAGTGVSWSIAGQSLINACQVTGTAPNQTLTCAFGSILPGGSQSVHITSGTTAASCSAYANTATLSATNSTSSVTASASTTVQCPSLTLSKTADTATVSAGDPIGYTITASNSSAGGTGTAAGVSLSDPLPGGTGVSWTIGSQPGGTPCSVTGNAPTQTLTCSFGSLDPGASVTVRVTSSTGAGSCGAYANTATLSASNVASSLTASATTTVQCPSLSISKTADNATPAAGTTIGYTITVSNSGASGTGTARNVAIADPLPAGPSGSGVSWSIASQTIAGACAITGSAPSQTLSCSLGDLAAGASGSVHITSTTMTASCGSYANTATLSATNVAASLQASATIDVGCAALTLAKTADSATVSAGGQIGFSLQVGNTGQIAAFAPSLSDTLPSGTGVSWSIASQPSGNPCSIGGSSPQILSCSFNDLAVNGSYTVHITSATSSGSCGSYSNSASVTASNSPPATASASITVQCPSLSVSKAADSATVSAGDQIGYTITASNSSATGTGTAAGVTVSDPLPSGTGVTWSIQSQPTGSPSPCAITGTSPQTLACSFGSLAPGASKAVHVTSATTGSSCASYANTASLSATNTSSSLTASATATVLCPSLTLGKSADGTPVSAGTSIGFSLSVSNASAQGTGTAKSVGISDPLPGGPNSSGVSWSIAGQAPANACQITGSAGSQTLACSFGDLAPGGTGSVHVTSATGASSCGSYANTATMTAGNAATLTASATISVQCPVLSISKTADSATVNAGSPVGYTMTASNSSASGTGTATGVSLTDTLPGGSGVSWSIQSQPSGNPCSLSGTTPQSLSCTLGTMAPGASNTVHVTGTTNGATCGLLTNTASLAATNIPAPLTQSAGITIQCPKLSITKTADSASVSAGTGIGYVITASNSSAAGTGTATGAAISDPLPAGTGVTWTIASQPSGNPCTITGSAPNQTLGCILGSVAPGASASIHLTSPTSAASCQSYANTVTLSATNVPTSLTGSASITVNCPHLTLSKTADKVVVNEGGQIGYKLSIGNTGLGSAAGVMLTDHLPAGSGISWSLTPAVSGCAITTGTLTCNLGTVGAGSSLSVHITSPTTQTSCATYPNTATLTASNNATLTGQATLSVACPTTSLYTGTQALVMGNTLTLTARVVGSAVCTSTGTVTFSLDRNPLAPGADPFPVTASVSNGVAMGATLSTTGWAAGVYMVTASYSGPAFCQPSHDSATLTVGLAGIAASIGAGGGRYTAPNSTSPYTVLFAFSAGHGTLQLRNAASWQLKGTLTQLVKGPNGNGAASGVGTLLLGTLTISNVAFTMSFHANSAPYTFGIHITYLPTGTQPRLPNAPPVPLTNGAIHLT